MTVSPSPDVVQNLADSLWRTSGTFRVALCVGLQRKPKRLCYRVFQEGDKTFLELWRGKYTTTRWRLLAPVEKL